MRKKTKKGFTLIELLAVIIIIAVIALITVPIVTGYIESSRKKGFMNSVYHGMQSIDEELANQDFAKFPEGGISAKNDLVNIERNPFVDGKYILKNKKMYADRVTDGRYCATGEKESLRVVLGDCYLLDETAPVISSVVAGTVTSNSIQVVVNAKDEESNIVSYEYSKDNGKTYTSKQTSNSYTFTNLTHNTSFSIVVRVTNENKLSSTKSITLKTLLINTPTFTSNPALGSWSPSKVVTITYPGTKQSNYIYEYRKDGGAWTTVSGTSQNVTFTANGTLEARVRDGYNTVNASTLTITTIDASVPGVPTSVVRYDSASGTVRGNSSAWTNRTLWWGSFSASDTGGSGINRYEYSQNCTGSKSGNLSSSHTYSSNTNYTFCIRAVDNAGNASGWSGAYYFRVDKSTPSITGLSNSSGGNWTNKNVTISFNVSETGGSGIARSEYSYNNSTWYTDWNTAANATSVSGTWSAERNNTAYIRTIDNAGNVSSSVSTIIRIDKTAPLSPRFNSFKITNGKTLISNNCAGKGGKSYAESCTICISAPAYFDSDVVFDSSGLAPTTNQYTWNHYSPSLKDYCPNWFTLPNGTGCTTAWTGNWTAAGNYSKIDNAQRTYDAAGNYGPALTIYFRIRSTGGC